MPSYSGSANTLNSLSNRFIGLGSFVSTERQECQVIAKCHNNPIALETFGGAKNVPAEIFRASLMKELENSIFVHLEGLAEDIMTDLPYDSEKMLVMISCKTRKSKGDRKPYSTFRREWNGWPETDQVGTEAKLASYLNMVSDTIRKRLGLVESPEDLVFSAVFKDSGPKHEETTDRKPDIVVVPRSRQNSKDLEWKDIMSFVSLKIGTQTRLSEMTQLMEYARMCFSKQPNRRFILVIGFIHNKFSVYVFDRSGILATPYYIVHDTPEKFIRLVIGLLFLSDLDMGFDTSFSRRGGARYLNYSETEYKILDDIYVDKSIRGRGTVCLKVSCGDEIYVVKDAWVDRTRVVKEVDLLKELKGSGMKYVPTLIKAGIVDVPVRNDDRTGTVEAVRVRKDCTEDIRKCLIKEVKETKGNEKIEDGCEELKMILDVEIRDHYRIVMQPFGERFDNFDSLSELLSATYDVLETIEALDKLQITHRDISLDNIILVRDVDNPERRWRRGYVIDFDYAIKDAQGEDNACGKRTGTVPFMAIDILKLNSKVKHSPIHDVESLLYILMWISCLQGGPRQQPRPDSFKTETSFLNKWCPFKKVDDMLLDLAADSKISIMENERRFMQTCEEAIHTYFEPLIPYFAKLRSLLFPSQLLPDSDATALENNSLKDLLNDDKRALPYVGGKKVKRPIQKVDIVRPRLSDVILEMKVDEEPAEAKPEESDSKKLPSNPTVASATSAPTDQTETQQIATDAFTVARSCAGGMKLHNMARVNYGPYREFMRPNPQKPSSTTGQSTSNASNASNAVTSSPPILAFPPAGSRSAGKRTLERAFGPTAPKTSQNLGAKRHRSTTDVDPPDPADGTS